MFAGQREPPLFGFGDSWNYHKYGQQADKIIHNVNFT